MTLHDPRFDTLYPDVDPQDSLPLSVAERLAISVAGGVLAFGAAYGDLIITGVGAALVLVALFAASRNTGRRIRSEARDRFPQLEWSENNFIEHRWMSWALPLAWLGIAVLSLLVLWLVPPAFALTGATAVGLVSAAILWFAPGLSPRWS